MDDEQPLMHSLDRASTDSTAVSPDSLNRVAVLMCGKEHEPGDHVTEIDSRVTCEGCRAALVRAGRL